MGAEHPTKGLQTEVATEVTEPLSIRKAHPSGSDLLIQVQVTGELALPELPSTAKCTISATEGTDNDMSLHSSGNGLLIQHFDLRRCLGKGRYGKVYLARHQPTNCICALKVMSKAECIAENEEELVRQELEVH